MARTRRAYGLAVSAVMIYALAWPAAAPVAATVAGDDITGSLVAPNIAAANIAVAAVRLVAEPVDADVPLAGDTPVEHAPLDLATLVQSVSEMNGVQLGDDMRCLASAVYYEARGESIEGQLAVAQVVLNRAANSRVPRGLCRVVHQPGQFSFTFDGLPDYPQASNAGWKRAEAIAIIAATGNWQDLTDNALFFHASYVNPGWSRVKEQTRQIGRHVFYR